MRKYQAVLSCPCGWSKELSDKEYEAIITEKEPFPRLGCGHWKYTSKIRAKHNVDPNGWRMCYGSTPKPDKEVGR